MTSLSIHVISPVSTNDAAAIFSFSNSEEEFDDDCYPTISKTTKGVIFALIKMCILYHRCIACWIAVVLPFFHRRFCGGRCHLRRAHDNVGICICSLSSGDGLVPGFIDCNDASSTENEVGVTNKNVLEMLVWLPQWRQLFKIFIPLKTVKVIDNSSIKTF